MLGAFDKLLTDGVRYSFGVEQQLLAIADDSVSSAGIAVPGL